MTIRDIINAILFLIRGPMSPEAVEAALGRRAEQRTEHLNWRASIVDLLKLLDLDSSIEARRKLAIELGYDGSAPDGSAEKNMWLHAHVMRRVAEHRI